MLSMTSTTELAMARRMEEVRRAYRKKAVGRRRSAFSSQLNKLPALSYFRVCNRSAVTLFPKEEVKTALLGVVQPSGAES
jgi:hypothetical protein